MFGNKLQNKAYVAPPKKTINRPPCNKPTKQEIKLNNLIDDLEKSKKKDMKTSGKLSAETKQKELELMKKLENEKPEWITYEEVKPIKHNEPPLNFDFNFMTDNEATALVEMRNQIERLIEKVDYLERKYATQKEMNKVRAQIDEIRNVFDGNNSMLQTDIQNLRNHIDEVINRPNPYENNLKSLEGKIEEIMKKPDNTEQISGKIKKLKEKIQFHRNCINDFSVNFQTMTEQFIDFEDAIKHIIEQATKTNIEEFKDLTILTMPFYTRKFRYTVLDGANEARVETINKEQKEKIMNMLNGLKNTLAGMTKKKDEKKDDWDDE
jgi:methyl-accepting chemotaxis protein